MGILTKQELNELGFKSLGNNVLISDKASIYGAEHIEIGNNVRIDDFVVLSAGTGGIYFGNYIHLSVQVSIIGAGRVELHDFSGVSAKVSIFSSSDDFTGRKMTNPTVPDSYRWVRNSSVIIGTHALIGANSVLLPGSIISDGVSVGALSQVSSKLDEWSIYLGNPVKKIMPRSRNVLKLEKEFLEEMKKYRGLS
ncbi:MAG: galactoside O-acetyltransferase [Gammaproteobacteria bacterium]|nr:MAG: galactoside O-acetyltransferase [Gammaproteobacteria bacterium]